MALTESSSRPRTSEVDCRDGGDPYKVVPSDCNRNVLVIGLFVFPLLISLLLFRFDALVALTAFAAIVLLKV